MNQNGGNMKQVLQLQTHHAKGTLRIDIETYCDLDIKDVGAYRYVDHESFEVLMIAYALGIGSPKTMIDLMTEDQNSLDFKLKMGTFMSHLNDERIAKRAFNANFERISLGKWLGRGPLNPRHWRCTMVEAWSMGYSRGLAAVAKQLNLPEDAQKLKEGKALINYFCKPCKPTKKNGKRTRNLPEHDMEKWELFKQYCVQDVVAEEEVEKAISGYTADFDWELWAIDQEINDRGVALDPDMIKHGVEYHHYLKATIKEELKQLTGVDNPNSDAQLKVWLTENTDIDAAEMGLNKKSIPKIREMTTDPRVLKMLDLRTELNKTSNAKYDTMERCVCSDGRARGLIQFYGAGRTGRWAGRLIQVQNLPKNKIEDLDNARKLVKSGNPKMLGMFYGDGSSILSQLIRTAFVPSAGAKFLVDDFSAIEARVLAWWAGCKWRMDVFNSTGKIYEASASKMFKVPLDTIVKGHDNYAMRAKGKVAELALGYGGAKGALLAMGALDMGVEEKDLKPLVNVWRKANKEITDLWWAVGDAALEAVREPGRAIEAYGVVFRVKGSYLFVTLPSGRKLAYVRPYIKKGRYDKDQLYFEGLDQTKGMWLHIDTYGPKLVENITQAMARDCLAESMKRLSYAGYKIVMHVHDEVIIEYNKAVAAMLGYGDKTHDQVLDDITEVMSIRPDWAQDLPLGADGFHCDYYMKD